MTTGVLAFVLIAVEEQGLLWSGPAPSWVYQGDDEAAPTVLSSITGSLITVTGVVFSVTVVAVQLSNPLLRQGFSFPYSPRREVENPRDLEEIELPASQLTTDDGSGVAKR